MRSRATLTNRLAAPALAVQGDPFHDVESQCRLTNPVSVSGMACILCAAECGGKGEAYSKRMVLMRVPEGLAVIENGLVHMLKACP